MIAGIPLEPGLALHMMLSVVCGWMFARGAALASVGARVCGYSFVVFNNNIVFRSLL